MTPTTPSKPPVDTIREASDVLRRSLADPEGITFHVRHGGDCRAWFQEPCSCSAQERFSEIMAALSALSSLSTQPSQTEGLEVDQEEIIEKAARFFSEDGVYHPADNYYIVERGPLAGDCARIIAGYLMDIMPSLPRQKGEPVAWMTKDGRVDTLGVVNGKKSRNTGPEYFGPHWCIPLYK